MKLPKSLKHLIWVSCIIRSQNQDENWNPQIIQYLLQYLQTNFHTISCRRTRRWAVQERATIRNEWQNEIAVNWVRCTMHMGIDRFQYWVLLDEFSYSRFRDFLKWSVIYCTCSLQLFWDMSVSTYCINSMILQRYTVLISSVLASYYSGSSGRL